MQNLSALKHCCLLQSAVRHITVFVCYVTIVVISSTVCRVIFYWTSCTKRVHIYVVHLYIGHSGCLLWFLLSMHVYLSLQLILCPYP